MGKAANARGFTLVEMLVAMVMTLVIMGVVMYGFNMSQRTSSRSTSLLEIHGRMEPALALLERDVNNAVLGDDATPVYRSYLESGTLKYGALSENAAPENRLWFRYHKTTAIERCEAAFPTLRPIDVDDDGHADARGPVAWVLWEAKRTKLDSGGYHLRLTRRLERFAGNNHHAAEDFYATALDAPVFLRSRDILGEARAATNTDAALTSGHDPDRYFGAEQVVFEVRETVSLPNARRPFWNLFPLSEATKSLTAAGITRDTRESTMEGYRQTVSGQSPNAWQTSKWAHATALYVDLEAYSSGLLDQSVRFRRTLAFPARPAN